MMFVLLNVLVLTIAIESAVAAAFGVGRRGIRAVTLVNLVTNPALNFTFLAVAVGLLVPPWMTILAFLLLEAGVVVAEWHLLLWALRGTAGPRDRLLGMSIAMNMTTICLSFVWWI